MGPLIGVEHITGSPAYTDMSHQATKYTALAGMITLAALYAATSLGYLTAEQFDEWVRPELMTGGL